MLVRGPQPRDVPRPEGTLAFGLFILLNVVLLIRPADVFPPLYGLPIYQGCILSCLAVALPAVSRMLKREGLAAEPISLCLVALLGAVALSHLSHGRIGETVSESWEFAKLLIQETGVAVAPGVGFGEYGDQYVRLALVENEQRIRQAARNIKKFLAANQGGQGNVVPIGAAAK